MEYKLCQKVQKYSMEKNQYRFLKKIYKYNSENQSLFIKIAVKIQEMLVQVILVHVIH